MATFRLGDILKDSKGKKLKDSSSHFEKPEKKDISSERGVLKSPNSESEKTSPSKPGREKKHYTKNVRTENKKGKHKSEEENKLYNLFNQEISSFKNFGLFYNKYMYRPCLVVMEGNCSGRIKRTNQCFKDFLQKGRKKIVVSKDILKNKLQWLEDLCEYYQSNGYEAIVVEAELKTSLVIGLGNEHPSENGFMFHWNSGVPFIPSESFKGVVRFQYFIRKLHNIVDGYRKENEKEPDDKEFEGFVRKAESAVEDVFGSSGDSSGDENKGAKRGKVVFFDVLPMSDVEVTLDITNPHYKEYYEGRRGPTEDQQPTPIFFLAVRPGAKFRFVYFVESSLDDNEKKELKRAFRDALTEHGFGAKTSLGHGRFRHENKILSFLGTGRYEEVVYRWSDAPGGKKEVKTHLFPYAVSEFFPDYDLILFVTEEAKQAKRDKNGKGYLEELKEKLKQRLRVKDILVGKNQEELWEIFNIIMKSVSEDSKGNRESKIVLDITHAFRSIPMFTMMAILFLKHTKNIKVEYVLYGAYEAKCKEDENIVVPVFDLSLLFELADWISAADSFMTYWNAEKFANILRTTHNALWKKSNPKKHHSKGAPPKPTYLSKLGGALESFSLAFWLAQPCKVMETAAQLSKMLEKAKSEVAQWAIPFTIILDELKDHVSNFVHPQCERLDKKNLDVQRKIIFFSFKKKLYMQAINMAREWGISWLILQSGDDKYINNWKKRETRKIFEGALGIKIQEKKRGSKGNEGDNVGKVQMGQKVQKEALKLVEKSWFQELDKKYQFVKFWSQLVELRNVISHCGMSEDAAKKIQDLREKIKKISEKLENFSLE